MNKLLGVIATTLAVATMSTTAMADEGFFSEPHWQNLRNTTAQEGITDPIYERAKQFRSQFNQRVDSHQKNVGPNAPRPLFLAWEDRPGPAFEKEKPPKPEMKPMAENKTFLFDWDSAELSPKAEARLDEVVRDYNARGVEVVRVNGFTDTSGPVAYNDELGLRRANNVANYLRNNGLEADVDTFSYGEFKLAVETADGVREPQNRRAVVKAMQY